MKEIQANMNFKAYWESLRNILPELRTEICDKLEISEKTFYNKLNSEDFSYPERIVIAQIINKPVEVLFPTQKTA